MAAGRHNLTRRALLGAAAGVPFAATAGAAGAAPATGSRWTRALAALRRAEVRLAAFKSAEALLPAERRAFPCDDLEGFGRLDSARLKALRRLLRVAAPDLDGLALKLDLAVADQAWELTGCEPCLAAIAADARRLCNAG